MGFSRIWNATCPRIWDKWEADGINWVVQDLPPEDDEYAVQLMLEQFCPDETLCSSLGIDKHAKCLLKMADFWRASVCQRMSLACYKGVGDDKTLAGLNICVVKCIDDAETRNDQMEMDGFFVLLQTLKYIDSKCNIFEELNVDKYLYGHGLLVTRENRGCKLGAKLLAAREIPSKALSIALCVILSLLMSSFFFVSTHALMGSGGSTLLVELIADEARKQGHRGESMCHEYGLPASATLFTGAASQKLALRCGFTPVVTVALKELAMNGLRYSEIDERILQIMTKKYM